MPRINALTKNEKRGELGTVMDDLVLLQQNRWDPKKTPCCGVGRPTAINFLFNPRGVWRLEEKEKRKALCLKYTLTKILPP